MKTIENLEVGECLLVSAKMVNGGKVSFGFAEKISNPNVRPQSILSALNASDDRFQQTGKARRAWIPGEAKDASALFGVDLSALKNVGDEIVINKLLPGYHIQITETTEGSPYQVANPDTQAKRAGNDGEFILSKEGKYIYTNATVVAGDASHSFLADTVRESAFDGTPAKSSMSLEM